MDYVFQKAYRIYFIMPFIQGGELFKHLSEKRRFSEEKTKFYAAQIALALGYLHQSDIIYRDLKPENILLNDDGYIMLADFGLAKILQTDRRAEPNSFCGTPEYLSPEMIVGSGHDKTLDWWALGILIYEMIIGIPPFYNPNINQMYYLIQNAQIRWPNMQKHGFEVSENAIDLISKVSFFPLVHHIYSVSRCLTRIDIRGSDITTIWTRFSRIRSLLTLTSNSYWLSRSKLPSFRRCAMRET